MKTTFILTALATSFLFTFNSFPLEGKEKSEAMDILSNDNKAAEMESVDYPGSQSNSQDLQASSIESPDATEKNNNQKETGKENVEPRIQQSDKPLDDKKKQLRRPLNRRWIINQSGGRNLEKRKPVLKPQVTWTDDAQREKCETTLDMLNNDFRKAKYYSVQGDSCRTSAFAEAFIIKAEQCDKGCPENFLDHNGISKESIRNIRTLYNLGREKCLGLKK